MSALRPRSVRTREWRDDELKRVRWPGFHNASGSAAFPGRTFHEPNFSEKRHPGTGHRVADDVRGPRGTRRVTADTRPDGLRPNTTGGYDVVEHKRIRAGDDPAVVNGVGATGAGHQTQRSARTQSITLPHAPNVRD